MKNPSTYPIHQLLQSRWSPYVFDSEKAVAVDDLRSVFEAARWAMSAYNDQPWRYIVADRTRDPELWEKVLACLVEGNRPWAQYAPVLALGLVTPAFEKTGKPNPTALHDLGAASAFLTVEATARGLAVHQMSGILPNVVLESFGEVASLKPVTALAIGYAGVNDELDESIAKRDERTRERKSLADIVIHGSLTS